MPKITTPLNTPEYDPRWFVWTIVFLVVTGISLVSYIFLSDDGTGEYQDIPTHARRTLPTSTQP